MTLSILVLLMAQFGTTQPDRLYRAFAHTYNTDVNPIFVLEMEPTKQITIVDVSLSAMDVQVPEECDPWINNLNGTAYCGLLPVNSRHPRIELPEPRLLNESSDSGPMMRLVKCDSKGCRQL